MCSFACLYMEPVLVFKRLMSVAEPETLNSCGQGIPVLLAPEP